MAIKMFDRSPLKAEQSPLPVISSPLKLQEEAIRRHAPSVVPMWVRF